MRDRRTRILRSLENCGFQAHFDREKKEIVIEGWILPIKIREVKGKSLIVCKGLHVPYLVPNGKSEIIVILGLLVHGVMPKDVKKTARNNNGSVKAFRYFRGLRKQRGKCCWCQQPISMRTATIEHLIPLCQGGSERDGNIKLACARCNNRRGEKSLPPKPEAN